MPHSKIAFPGFLLLAFAAVLAVPHGAYADCINDSDCKIAPNTACSGGGTCVLPQNAPCKTDQGCPENQTCSPAHVCSANQSGASAATNPLSNTSGNTNPLSNTSGNTNPLSDTSGNTGTSGSPCQNQAGALQNPLKACSLPQLLDDILQAIVQIGSILLVVMLVFVGFQFVMAQGNPGQLAKARQALLWTVIGGLLLLGASGLGLVIQATAANL